MKTFLTSVSLFALSLFATSALAEQIRPPTPDTVSDGQIVKIISTANNGEINESQLVLAKASRQDVKDFALEMVKAHTQASMDLGALTSKIGVNAEQSEESQKMERDVADQIKALKSASGAELDKLYVTDQVNAHQMLLDRLDQTLIPQARNADLRTFLQTFRDKVQQHLTMAQKLLANL